MPISRHASIGSRAFRPHPTKKAARALAYPLEPTSPAMAVFMLLLLTAVFLALACLVFSFKEYILDE